MNEIPRTNKWPFKELIELFPGALVIIDNSTKIVNINDAALALFQYDKDELMGTELNILLPDKFKSSHKSEIKEFFNKPLKRNMGKNNELFGIRKDGNEIPLEVGLNPMETADGIFVMASIIDITHRKEIEGELIKYKYFFNQTRDLTCIANSKGYFEVINKQFEFLLGYTEKEMLENSFFDYIHPDDIPATLNEIERLGNGESTVSFLNRYRKKNGDYLWFEWSATPDPVNGKLYATARDVTLRINAETQFRMLIKSIPNSIVVINSRGEITMINKQTELLFGYSGEELINQNLEVLIPDRYRKMHHSYRNDFLKSPKTRSMGAGRDLFALRKDGTEFPAEIGLNPIKTGSEMLVLASIIDITERKKLENDLNEITNKIKEQNTELVKSEKKLKEAVITKDKFFSILAHDLKNPFNIILGYSQLLISDYDDLETEKIMEFLSEIYSSSKTTYSLLENLLGWALSQQNKINIDKKHLKVREVISSSLTPYTPNSRKKNITIDVNINNDSTIFADKYTLITALSNIISNAIKFTHNNGKITINSIETKENIELHICDTGIGLNKNQIHNLFRIENSTTTAGTEGEEGTGLGLLLSKEFIEKNGGSIKVVSKVGKGSTFIVSLPKK
jgi:PAS domain S-box-containing protein